VQVVYALPVSPEVRKHSHHFIKLIHKHPFIVSTAQLKSIC